MINTLLAKVEHGTSTFNRMIGDLFFKNKQGMFEQNAIPYLKDLFSVEATNSAGAPRVELIVDGVSFGKLTS